MTSYKKLIFGALAYLLTFNSYADIFFETDFRNDADFNHKGPTKFPWTNIGSIHPEGFSGTLIEGAGSIRGMAGEGEGGSVALKFEWDPALGQPVTQLFKHLTGNSNTGYDEVFIRYKVRLPNKFKAGTPGPLELPYWKWGRLWQNTATHHTGTEWADGGGAWTENRDDSFYAVWNFGGSLLYGIDASATFGSNNGIFKEGSASGGRYSNDYYIDTGKHETYPGHFQHVGNGAWELDDTRFLVNNTSQTWHTIEWRFKLSSTDTSGDGIFQMWFDGVEQKQRKISQGKAGAYTYDPPLQPNALPTAKHGTGYNMFVMFDNMAFWNKDWADSNVENGIYVNDLVISTSRIGHDYKVAGAPPNIVTPPKPPALFASQ